MRKKQPQFQNVMGQREPQQGNVGDNIQQTKSPPSRSFQEISEKSFHQSKRSVVIKDTDLDNYHDFKQNAKLMIQEELKQLEHLATQPTYEQRERGDDYNQARDYSSPNYNSYDFNNFINSPQQMNNDGTYQAGTQRNQNFYNTAGPMYNHNQIVQQNNQQAYQTQNYETSFAPSSGQNGLVRLSTLTNIKGRIRQLSSHEGNQYYTSQINSQGQINTQSLQSAPMIISPTARAEANQSKIQFVNQDQLQNLQQIQQTQAQVNAMFSQQMSIQSTNQTSGHQQQPSNNYYSSFGPLNGMSTQANQQTYFPSQQIMEQQQRVDQSIQQNENSQIQQYQNTEPLQNRQPHFIQESSIEQNSQSIQKKIVANSKLKEQSQYEEIESRKDDSLNLNFQPNQIVKFPKAKQHYQDSNFMNQQELDELNKQKPQKSRYDQEIVNKLVSGNGIGGQFEELEQENQMQTQNTDRNVNLILHYESSIHSNVEDSQSNLNLSIEKNKNQQHFQFNKEPKSIQINKNPVKENIKKKADFNGRYSVDSRNITNANMSRLSTLQKGPKNLNQSKNDTMLNASALRNSKHYMPNLQQGKDDYDANPFNKSIKAKITTEDDDEEYSVVQSEMNQEEKDEAQIKYLRTITYKQQDPKKYNPLQIPPDWEFAKKHAMSRTTARPSKDGDKFCPCCGYVINRVPLPFSIDTQQLNFLGSGYPLFYNFIIYCIFMLFALFMISGGYNLFTNYLGNYCLADEQELDSTFKKRMEILGYKFEGEETICHNNIFHTFSLANKKDRPELLKVQSYLNLFVSITMMIILMFFRRNQRQIDMEIDASLSTPQDYTIMVKNIPSGLEGIDYKKELETIFNYHSVPGKVLQVENINLIYNIQELIEQEHKLSKTIKEKQEFLKKEGGFQKCEKEKLHQIDEKIEHIEESIEKLEKEIPKDPSKFSGTAFISFLTEQQKKDCLKENVSGYMEQVQVWWNNGQKNRPSEKDLMWGKNKLFIEEAPEPDDIDWEFIHVPTKNKLFWRFYCFCIKMVFMAISFFAISAIAKFQSHLIEHAYEEIQHGKIEDSTFGIIKSLSFIISAIIVLFNKFVLAEVFHYIADSERWSTKTKLNISFADSLSLGLFLNSAIITYVVEIIHYKNYYGPGGFIYTESWVFIWNSILPPLVWTINPYQMYKESQRKKQLQLAKQKMCFLTQQEANNLMEDYDYIQGKRYADIMKTMWFTFLYAPCIPLGNFFSMFNLVAYYYIDKYNILRRSTVKENLSKQVSLQMTENLEYIIVFFALGNFTFSIHLFNTVEWSSIIMLAIGLIYAILPMQDLNEYLFHIEDLDEEISYQEAKLSFKTDYDRLNPITKKESLKKLVQVFQKGVSKIQNINKLKFLKFKQ